MIIIGFVSGEKINEETSVEYCLPIGFAKNGSKSKQWEECQLILVDDKKFNRSEIPCCGKGIDAILIQHNTSSEKIWNAQRKWIRSQGWKPKDSKNGFSHIQEDFFWEEIKNLVQANDPNKKADIIKSLIERYMSAEAFRALDIEVAHKIIQAMQSSEESDIREYLKCANKRAFDMFNPQKQNENDTTKLIG